MIGIATKSARIRRWYGKARTIAAEAVIDGIDLLRGDAKANAAAVAGFGAGVLLGGLGYSVASCLSLAVPVAVLAAPILRRAE